MTTARRALCSTLIIALGMEPAEPLAMPARRISSPPLARLAVVAARVPRAARTTTAMMDYSSEIDNLPLWVSERPLLPGFQERASVEVSSWWQMHDSPVEVARVTANSSVGTLVRFFTVEDERLEHGVAVVMQARARVQVLRSRTRDSLRFADVQLLPDSEEVSTHLDLAVHALGSLPRASGWLNGTLAEQVVRRVAVAASAATARTWGEYECSDRIGSFKFGVTELVRMNRTVDTMALASEANALAKAAASQAAQLAHMRWGAPADAPAGWEADGPAGVGNPPAGDAESRGGAEDARVSDAAARAATTEGDGGADGAPRASEPVHVVLAASAAARCLSQLAAQAQQAGSAADGALGNARVTSLNEGIRTAEWELWLTIDSVWFLLSKLSSKRSLLLPDQVLQLQPPPPPGGWEHQHCMQQGSAAVATSEWAFDEAYPTVRRAQRLSFVASSLMPGAPQQQLLEIGSVGERLAFLTNTFRQHELALRSLVALQEIETEGNAADADDEPPARGA